MAKQGKKQTSAGAGDPPRAPFVAIHHEAWGLVSEWLHSNEHRAVAKKFVALSKALIAGDQEAVDNLLRQLRAKKVGPPDGLVRMGPRKKKGGAPRVSLYRGHDAEIFVDAELKKTNGKADLENARGRAMEMQRLFKSSYGQKREQAKRAIERPAGHYLVFDR